MNDLSPLNKPAGAGLPELRECESSAIQKNEAGKVRVIRTPVFPGIKLMNIRFCTDIPNDGGPVDSTAGKTAKGDLLVISYCAEGRVEYSLGNRVFVYAGPGDVAFCAPNRGDRTVSFPLGFYRGLTLTVDFDTVAGETKRLLCEFLIEPEKLAGRLSGRSFTVEKASADTARLFTELLKGEMAGQETLRRLKTLELLLAISQEEPGSGEKRCLYRTQVEVAKRVRDRITVDPAEHIKIEQLAKEQEVSPTYLKNCFPEVYGTSIYAYQKNWRLELAAEELRKGSLSVSEIATKIGYENPNKFTDAFHRRYGLPPTEFRWRGRLDRTGESEDRPEENF